MGYRKHLFNPDAKRAEAALREREAIKDAAYESFELLYRLYVLVADQHALPLTHSLIEDCAAHIKKIKGGK